MKRSVVVGIGGLEVCSERDIEMKTLGLGSCVAVILTDPIRNISGLAHVVYPNSTPDEVAAKPAGYFADLAIPALLDAFKKLGSGPRMAPMVTKIIGGAQPTRNHAAAIGKRNVLAVKKALFRNGLAPTAEDTGGAAARSVFVEVGSPEVRITSPDREEKKL